MISPFGRSRREPESGRAAAVTPAASRRVTCSHCQAPFEVSIKAINARCPKCTRPMGFQDADLNGFCMQNLNTMGTVRVGRKGVVRGRIECGQLVVSGQLDGHVRISGCCVVQSGGTLRGEIAARSMIIERGGALEGTVEIGMGGAAKPGV